MGVGLVRETYLRNIMASATSVHWNSSKQSTLACAAISAAMNGTVSMSMPCSIFSLCDRLCTSCMKLWKCIRVFDRTELGSVS